MGGMVNTCELSINVVKMNKPKMLRGLGKNGIVVGTGVPPSPVTDNQHSRRTESTSPVLVNPVERGKPVSLLSKGREESRKANRWQCGYGGGKKRRPSCSGTDTGCNITRRASGLTSLRCLDTRTTEESVQKVLQMSVDVCHWCYLPRKGIDLRLVSCSQRVA